MYQEKNYINENCCDEKAISVLKRISLFKGLFDNEFNVLLEICSIKSFERSEKIFNENDTAKSLFVILNGKVGFSTEEKGVIDIFSTGEVFGVMGVITSNTRVANAIALSEKLTVFEVLKGDFDLLLGRAPRVSYIIMKNMASELAERFVHVNDESFSVRSNRSPRVNNIAMQTTEHSRIIKIEKSKEASNKITHFKISNIKDASLKIGNHIINSENSFITVQSAKQGLRFEPKKVGLKKYSFVVEQSDDGINVNSYSDESKVYVFMY